MSGASSLQKSLQCFAALPHNVFDVLGWCVSHFFGKIDTGYYFCEQREQFRAHCFYFCSQPTGHRRNGKLPLAYCFGLYYIEYGFRLSQIDFACKKSSLGKLSGPRESRSAFHAGIENFGRDDGAAVAARLEREIQEIFYATNMK